MNTWGKQRSNINIYIIVYVFVIIINNYNGVHGSRCTGAPKPNAQPNLNHIYTSAPTFVKSVTNASLYHVGDGEDQISVVHLWGNAYQRGYAHGLLMKNDTAAFYARVYPYFEQTILQAVNGSVPWLPKGIAKWIAKVGLGVALDLTYDVTEKYTGQWFKDEMKGLADGSGVDEKYIRRVHMIGELTQGHCSMYGAWGAATASGATLQLRALDWDTDGPFQDYPQVTVYHADDDEDDGHTLSTTTEGHSFANVGWTGWIGSISGISSKQMAISEIGVSFPDKSFGKESREGVPFTFLLRDILQFDNTLDDSINHIKNAHRTCDLILGVGDGKPQQNKSSAPFRGIQYSHSVANFFDDTNMLPKNDTWHARIPNMVYYGMDWLCPGYSVVLHRQLKAYHGKLTPENTVKNVVPIVQTGDLHVVISDLTNMNMFVANARGSSETGPLKAFDRQFVKLDMKEMFATTTSVNSELGVCSVCKEAVKGLIAAGAGGACGAACAATGCEPCVPYCASICGSIAAGETNEEAICAHIHLC